MQALLFLPDISGFTKFVNDTEIEHSQHILRDLLEVILDVNQLNLTVSEIEGDAVFFYRMGEAPALEEMLQQIEKMFLSFHTYIKEIERDRICDCGACRTAINLTLKFIVHYGDINISKIKEHTKLVGKDVIIAHRLLKNNIEGDEYVLLSAPFMNSDKNKNTELRIEWAEQRNGSVRYDHIGDVDYTYVILTQLKSRIPQISHLKTKNNRSKHPVIVKQWINAPMSLLYNALIDLSLRMKWTDGLKSIHFDENEIPRIGSKHICEVSFGELELETIQRKLQKGMIEYAERANNLTIVRNATTFYIMKDSEDGTLLIVEFHYRPRPVIGWIINLFFRPAMRKSLTRSIKNFKIFCEDLYSKN